jgi:multiple sugar transport system substrate-binding protein
MTFKFDRRQFLMSGVAAAGLGLSTRLSLAAGTSLRVAWWGGKARADLTQKALDLYVSKNPEISIDSEYLGWGDYWARLSTMTAGGNSPDVIQMDIEYLADYGSRGVLLDLSPLIPSPLNVSDFQQDLLDNGKYDGKQYAVPCGVNAGALIVDKDAFDEAGVALPGFGTTWDEFGALMAAFSKATPRKGMFGTPDASGNQPVLETWLRQRGKQLFNTDGTLAYDEADMTEWFEMWAAMRASGAAASPDVQALDHGDVDTSLMAQGRAAVNFENSNQYVASQALTKDALMLAPYPKLGADGKGGLYIKPTMFYSISSQSPNGEAAAALLNFVLSDPEATAILGGERGLPASAAVRERLKPNMDAAGQAMLDYLGNLGDLAGPLPPPSPPGQGEVTEALVKASEEVSFGAKSAAQGAKDFVESAKTILSRTS